MKDFLAVVNSNRVNRYGMLFPVPVLESALDQSWEYGIPSLISHDMHRPVAWMTGMGVHIEPGLVRLMAICHQPETAEESNTVGQTIRRYLSHKLTEINRPHIEELKRRLGAALTGSEKYGTLDCSALVEEGLAVRACPSVFKDADKDGLVPISDLRERDAGVYEKDGLLLFAHPYFRRSLSRYNNLNGAFLSLLAPIRASNTLDVRIALDRDMVGLPESYTEKIELEYWWGPKFTDDISKIPCGVTRHEAQEHQKVFYGLSRSEFGMYDQDGKRVFECEELRDIPSYGVAGDQYGCRYAHTMFAGPETTPCHVDGAVRLYDEGAMVDRLNSDIAKAGRHTDYHKLWRIDGTISVSQWKELLTHYFRDNSLVGEYFGGHDPVLEDAQTCIVQTDKGTVALPKHAPCSMSRDTGIRLSISYHHIQDAAGSRKRWIVLKDWLQREQDSFYYLEADTIELLKLLKVQGKAIIMPASFRWIAFEDKVLNLPLLMHAGEGAVSSAQDTQAAIATLCKQFANRGDERDVAFSIGIRYSDRDVYYSVAGHASALSAWLAAPESHFPSDVRRIGKWLEDAYAAISRMSSAANDSPRLFEMQHLSGMLHFSRLFLDPQEFSFSQDDKGDLIITLAISKEKKSLLQALQSGELTYSQAFIIQEGECSKCHRPYEDCTCSKYFEEAVKHVIKRCELLTLFWTDRTAWSNPPALKRVDNPLDPLGK